MKIPKFTDYIFKNYTENQVKLALSISLSLILSAILLASQPKHRLHPEVPEDLRVNLNVLIPPNYLLYPFLATNFESLEPLLDAYNVVRVYNPKDGSLLAKNIQMLRAPKDPNHLSFLVPVKIANNLARFGLDFKIAIQKNTEQKPIWALKKVPSKTKLNTISFGG